MVGNEQYNFFDKVLVRTPFYSFQDYAPAHLEKVLQREEFRNALWLASKEFYGVLARKDFDFSKINEKERNTLLKYYNRMSFRATPFGAFATYSLAPWGGEGNLRLVDDAQVNLHFLPSLAWQRAHREYLARNAGDVLLLANPGLYKLGNSLRFTRSEQDSSGKHHFYLHAIERGAINDYLVKRAEKHAVKKSDLIIELLERADCSPEQARDYIDYLVADEVLLTEFQPSLIACAVSVPVDAGSFSDFVKSISVVEPGSVSRLASGLNRHAALLGLKPVNQPLYTLSERPLVSGGINRKWQSQISEAVCVLHQLSQPAVSADLAAFTAEFRDKFEAMKVPLLTALDPDSGISFGNLHQQASGKGLLEGVRFPVEAAVDRPIHWGPTHRLFLQEWLQNKKRDTYEPVEVSEANLELLGVGKGQSGLLPPSIAVMFHISDHGLVVDTAGGVTATALPGRFSAFDNGVLDMCREIAREEAAANPDVVFAEIHQLSHDLVDNINRRQQVYDHSIEINTFPAAGTKGRILPADLVLYLADNKLILESVSLGKRIIPRLPTAYNFRHSENALFRLLCELQYQEFETNIDFDLARLFPGLPFYPRVIVKKVIIGLAKWILNKVEVAALTARPYSIGGIHLFRQSRGIPRNVALGTGDQQLFFDLGRDEEALFFLDCLKPGDNTITEFLPPAGNIRKDQQSSLAAECISFLHHRQQIYTGLNAIFRKPKNEILRRFLPFDDWLYLKIYCTPESASLILLDLIAPVIARNRKKILCWFFLRYHDPDQHLRIRINAADKDAHRLVAAFNRMANGHQGELIKQLSYEPYHRELERYGEVMAEVENIFCSGSEWATRFLARLRDNPGDNYMELAPLVLVYRWTCIFLPEPSGRAAFFGKVSDLYQREFHAEKTLKTDLDLKYRAIAGDLDHFITKEESEDRQAWDVDEVPGQLTALSLSTADWPEWRREKLLGDLIHMQVNRIYPSAQRRYEGLIYYCLNKYMVSRLARTIKAAHPVPGN